MKARKSESSRATGIRDSTERQQSESKSKGNSRSEVQGASGGAEKGQGKSTSKMHGASGGAPTGRSTPFRSLRIVCSWVGGLMHTSLCAAHTASNMLVNLRGRVWERGAR